jgi:hypothetical protein
MTGVEMVLKMLGLDDPDKIIDLLFKHTGLKKRDVLEMYAHMGALVKDYELNWQMLLERQNYQTLVLEQVRDHLIPTTKPDYAYAAAQGYIDLKRPAEVDNEQPWVDFIRNEK